ncbi:hypothetical protein N7510_000191 [Penicillium lagena]|uniref:uncharacterized protein n=1 Tax=Penicillium lagena TaxID=94218 RepID=UPI002541B40D|nr:uncharacterized protein N7510_000191 [Penicillium lagena]KAJ5623882.1 hypothetical protein N7510_000191 [Penicillium lagena]
MRFELPILLGLAAAASASTWTVNAFTDTECQENPYTWSGDDAESINTGNWYSSIVASYPDGWTFTAWTGAEETGDAYQPAANTCQIPANGDAVLSFTLAES